MRPVVTADRKAAARRVHRVLQANKIRIAVYIHCGAQTAVGMYRQHGNASSRVIRNQRKLPRAIQTQIRRARAFRADSIQQRQRSALRVDRKRAHGTGQNITTRAITTRAIEVVNLVECIQELLEGCCIPRRCTLFAASVPPANEPVRRSIWNRSIPSPFALPPSTTLEYEPT